MRLTNPGKTCCSSCPHLDIRKGAIPMHMFPNPPAYRDLADFQSRNEQCLAILCASIAKPKQQCAPLANVIMLPTLDSQVIQYKSKLGLGCQRGLAKTEVRRKQRFAAPLTVSCLREKHIGKKTRKNRTKILGPLAIGTLTSQRFGQTHKNHCKP